MAEPEGKSLDDFFAKRDKKRKKEKSKSKEQQQQQQQHQQPPPPPSGGSSAAGALKKNKKEKEKEKAVGESGADTQPEKEDEEWKEFEQKEVDYSGLRIQSLQISGEKEEEENEKKEEKGEDGEDSSSGGGDRSVGPWNKSAPAPAPTDIVTEPVESKPSGVYRPPAARMSGVRRGTPQGPPEIFSDAQFPSLQSTAKQIETRK
ncbi:protein CDV3 homolog isoform X2 [Latimeria chalumnae]|nr:PREDICTED: protein CDV3 homolog isoform X2 [Latimeria chalumnae]|eukprot:XP_014352453.1 PREDICTED: protein CDV3 homolog isoform X2 [Latimeria chalumnae]